MPRLATPSADAIETDPSTSAFQDPDGDGNVWTGRGAVAIVVLSIVVLRSGCCGLVLAGTAPAPGAAPPATRTGCQTAHLRRFWLRLDGTTSFLPLKT